MLKLIFDFILNKYKRKKQGIESLNLNKPLYIHPVAKFVYNSNIKLKKYTRIGSDCFLNGEGGITIEEGSILAPSVTILTSSHNYSQNNLMPYDFKDLKKPVTIGKGCWIGSGAMIVPGVKIGDAAVIAMGSVVTRDVPPGALVGGNPSKIIKYRKGNFQNLIEKQLFFIKHKIDDRDSRKNRKKINKFKYLIK